MIFEYTASDNKGKTLHGTVEAYSMREAVQRLRTDGLLITGVKPASGKPSILARISGFMNKVMRDQNPATEYDLRKYYPHHYQKTVSTRRERMYSYILLNLKKGKEEGLYREDLDEVIIAKLHLSRSENVHFNELFTVEEFTSMKLFGELLAYHVRGIATEKGITVLEKKLKELETNTNK